MMKRFLTTIVAILYLCSSIGATIHLHYCFGKLTRWEIAKVEGIACAKWGMPKCEGHHKHKCCNDQYKTFKTGDQKLTSSNINLSPNNTTSVINYPEQAAIRIISAGKTDVVSTAPYRSERDLYLIHCIFLI